MILDAYYPFIGNWMRAIGSCDAPPTPEWMASLSIQCETNMETMYHLLGDMWWILRTRVAGRAQDIVLHVSETNTAVATRDLRVPLAWYHLERESGGRSLDRRFELNRKAAHPDKVKSWAEVPSAIRNWERALVQWEHMRGHVMDQITKCRR